MIKKDIELLKISETYIKFKFEYNKTNQELIRKAYLEQIGYSSRDFIKNKELLKISIEYEEGSLKTRIVVWTTAIYIGIANYGSFRAGIRELVNDSRRLSEYTIQNIENDQSINHADIIRTERRTGLPGRIQDLYNKIDSFEREINHLSQQEIQNRIRNIKEDVSNIFCVLQARDGQEFISELKPEYKTNLPEPNERKVHYLLSRYALKPDEEIEFINNPY